MHAAELLKETTAMTERLKIIGSYLSPYVRKVLVCLELKGVGYEIDPIAPFIGNDEFTRRRPLRRVPVLIDGRLVLNDSSVICQYLEDKYPQSVRLSGRPRRSGASALAGGICRHASRRGAGRAAVLPAAHQT